MVLVHNDDLKCIESAIPPPETLQPDALMRFFRAGAPKIHQFQCGKYFAEPWFHGLRPDRMYTQNTPGNDIESEAEVANATVATLSQNMFEAPLDEGDSSRSISTSKAASNCTCVIPKNWMDLTSI